MTVLNSRFQYYLLLSPIYREILFLFYSQLSCYFVFEVTDMGEKILSQLFSKCSANDELSVNNGNSIYLDILYSRKEMM